ncbi:hypothetical protein [Halobacteriovorax sp. HLS]|uniref:hypothetical protein n=1 Tax=Halobacteriovorax sp. HLS TaxID=2234000 RepID=UPI000FD7956B|nr:hypothetical protein [Halobacteriovorax sp. HLS]
MKKLIALGVIVLSMNANAACTEDFNKGLSEFDFAMTYFNTGASSYQLAVDESRGQGRRSVICSHLLKSTTGFDVAKSSFTNCGSAFNSAISSCSGQSSDIARENAGVCAENTEVATNNYQQVALTLKRTCFIAAESGNIILPKIQEI